ncbi:hypothetical protein Pmar_PMAR009969, partial [Perkinsus marinus ATCC 50983]
RPPTLTRSPQPRPLAHNAREIVPDPPREIFILNLLYRTDAVAKSPPPPPRMFGPSDFIRNHLCPERRHAVPPSG